MLDFSNVPIYITNTIRIFFLQTHFVYPKIVGKTICIEQNLSSKLANDMYQEFQGQILFGSNFVTKFVLLLVHHLM